MKNHCITKSFVPWLSFGLCAALVAGVAPARAQDDDDDRIGFERTPPRLSFIDGDASFWRSGAEDWTQARVNTALAAGDELYTDDRANLELQIGPRAFARAGEKTQLGLTGLEPDFLQLRVTTGHVSLDLRSLKTGQTIELDTPNAAFSVEHSGYYRVEVEGDTTTFTSRRGGRAHVTPATGESTDVSASEQVVVSGTDAPQIESYAAPELDAWDRWNYARTDDQLDAVSARYVPLGVYGADDLDHHGDWRVLPTYGAVWVPRHVAVGWAPYSTGRWIFDPYYGWTWVDDAPWGWAPYHYGRWVHVSGYWGWCPGALVVRPLYAPALVAFFGGGGFSVGVTIGQPHIGWVALGWGEPLVPWWGPAHFREHAHWAGWRGPRVVNQVVVKHKTVYKANQINIYENAGVRDAVVEVDRDHFGRHSGKEAGFTRARAGKLSPLHGDINVKPDRTSLVANVGPAKRPPQEGRNRSVVATREPRLDPEPQLEPRRAPKGDQARSTQRAEPGAPELLAPARVAQPPHEGKRREVSRRAPFGTQSESERRMPPPPPRFQKPEAERGSKQPTQRRHATPPEQTQRSDAGQAVPPPKTRERARPERSEPAQPEERATRTRPERGAPSIGHERAAPPPRDLPGEPANRVYRAQRPERQSEAQRESMPRAERSHEDRPQKGDGGGAREERDPQREHQRDPQRAR
jgi:hypothetical protein